MLHSVWARANAIFFFYVSGIAILSGGCSLMFFTHESDSSVVIANAESVRLRYVSRGIASGEQAHLKFDMDVDLTSEWNWDVKQIFMFLTASFETPGKTKGGKPQIHNIVVWDAVIQEREDALFRLRGQKGKYPIVDFQSQLRGTEVELTLHWDIMPTVGLLKFGGGSNGTTFSLPASYT